MIRVCLKKLIVADMFSIDFNIILLFTPRSLWSVGEGKRISETFYYNTSFGTKNSFCKRKAAHRHKSLSSNSPCLYFTEFTRITWLTPPRQFTNVSAEALGYPIFRSLPYTFQVYRSLYFSPPICVLHAPPNPCSLIWLLTCSSKVTTN
jgi:hypothetical protein